MIVLLGQFFHHLPTISSMLLPNTYIPNCNLTFDRLSDVICSVLLKQPYLFVDFDDPPPLSLLLYTAASAIHSFGTYRFLCMSPHTHAHTHTRTHAVSCLYCRWCFSVEHVRTRRTIVYHVCNMSLYRRSNFKKWRFSPLFDLPSGTDIAFIGQMMKIYSISIHNDYNYIWNRCRWLDQSFRTTASSASWWLQLFSSNPFTCFRVNLTASLNDGIFDRI